MTISFVRGDIFLSRAQVIAVGTNARGDSESTPLYTELLNRYPPALAAYRKHTRAGRIQPGEWWLWQDTSPWLALLTVRQASGGATRTRYVEDIARKVARDWQREGLHSMAVAQMGEPLEWPSIREVCVYWWGSLALPVVIYEEYVPGLQSIEPLDA